MLSLQEAAERQLFFRLFHRTANGNRSDGGRNPIGRRTQSDWAADAIRSDGGRNPIGRRTQTVDLRRCNFRGCTCLKCTNQAGSTPTKQEVHQPSYKCTNQANKSHATRLVHFLLWQAAKPSGDKCTPFISPPHAAGRSVLRARSLPRRAAATWLHPSPCGLPP